MRQGIYIGYRSDLQGKVADLKPSLEGGIAAKFVDTTLPATLTTQWNQFSRMEFDIGAGATK